MWRGPRTVTWTSILQSRPLEKKIRIMGMLMGKRMLMVMMMTMMAYLLQGALLMWRCSCLTWCWGLDAPEKLCCQHFGFESYSSYHIILYHHIQAIIPKRVRCRSGKLCCQHSCWHRQCASQQLPMHCQRGHIDKQTSHHKSEKDNKKLTPRSNHGHHHRDQNYDG